MEYESRAIEATLELRGEGDGPRTLVGISPPWDTLSKRGAIRGGVLEKFERGAFSNLTDDIVATVEHDKKAIIGRTSAGTLRLQDSPEGLRFEVDLDDTTDAVDLAKRVRRGDITGASFEFAVPKPEGHRVEIRSGGVIRTILEGGAILRQVGPVGRPAFDDVPAVSLRCAEEIETLTAPPVDDTAAIERAHQLREAELALAESGLSV